MMNKDARKKGQARAKEEIRADLLRLYIKNHRGSVFSYIFVCLPFVYLKVRFYHGIFVFDWSFYFSIFLLFFSLFFVANQQFLYKRVIENQNALMEETSSLVIKLCLNKALYIIPWLYFLFQPLQSNYVFSHLPGYAFVFCAISAYLSSSATFFRVFLWDLFLSVGGALLVVCINFHVQETPYVGVVLLMVLLGALMTGWKIHQSAIDLFQNKVQLQEAVQAAEQASKAKSDFLAFVSHEIRTPMAGILGMVNFLKQTPLNQEQREYLDTISGCSDTLMNTLNDSLDIAKIEAGKLKIEMRSYEPKVLLQSVARLVEPVAAEKGLTILLEVENNFPEYSTGDPNRLQQVLTNLMNNAIKFTDKGTVKLGASVLNDPARLKISVTDTGIGIGEEEQKRLFRKFSQVGNAKSNTQKGFGLGLSISKNLTQLMGGSIGLESRKGHGSTLWIELPHQRPAENPKPVVKLPEPGSMMARFEVLIVDDNRINRMISRKILESAGHDVLIAETGRQAIQMMAHSRPDIVLMDINMPDMTGLEVTQIMAREFPKLAKVPVVALTANMSSELWENCKRAGMVDYLLKPYQPNDLYGMIARYVVVDKSRLTDIPFVREKENSYNKTNPRMDALREMFGLEYTRMFIKTGIDEVDHLLERIKKSFSVGDKEGIKCAAHDLTACSGTLGMDSLCAVSKDLESQSLVGQEIVLGALIHEVVIRLEKGKHDLLDWLAHNNYEA